MRDRGSDGMAGGAVMGEYKYLRVLTPDEVLPQYYRLRENADVEVWDEDRWMWCLSVVEGVGMDIAPVLAFWGLPEHEWMNAEDLQPRMR